LVHLLFDFTVRMHSTVAPQVRRRPISGIKENTPDFANKDVRQGADWPLLTGAERLEVLGTHKKTRLVARRLVFAAIDQNASNVE
jgi:hypothetical protein